MQALFLSHNASDSADAYNYRLRTLAELIGANGFDARMAYLGDPPLARPTLLQAAKVRNVPGIGEASVLHAGSAAVAYSCAFLPKKKGRLMVFDMHGDTVAEQTLAVRGWFDVPGKLRVGQEAMKERRGLRHADRVLVVSEPLRRQVVSRGCPEERVAIVRNGVELDRFRAAPPPPERERPLLVYAGRFERWQGVDLLLRLAASAGDAYDLRIIGFGEEDRAVRAEFERFGSRGVECRERVSQSELIPLLTEGDALLVPRRSSRTTEVAMPTKFAEYLALGRPVLLTRVGEPATMVERERCGVVAEADEEGIVAAAKRFAATSRDERAAMGRSGRALAEREFDWKKIGADYAAFLKDAVERES